MGELNVSFQIDTDNQENFSSQSAFSTFRKQRDLFYETLRIWEENHLLQGWFFQIALGGKIHMMLTLHNDTTNYCHFARLFKSQLLISCIKVGQEETVDEDSLDILKTLKGADPKKLTQLNQRFVTPSSSENLREPSFPGVQEFFKDFILHAFNPIFYTHLENCFVHEIMELNKSQLVGTEIEESEIMIDDQTKLNFLTSLSSLRLLAKMLGLVVSLPYRSESKIPKQIISTQLEIRSEVIPSLDLYFCLQYAVVQGKLSLTIPWLVKYLAMLDSVSLRLPYYIKILEFLYYLHQAISRHDYSTSDNPISQQAGILIKSVLHWLFKLPYFPTEFSSNWQKTYKLKDLKSFCTLDRKLLPWDDVLSSEEVASTNPKNTLDKLDIIDDKVMRVCLCIVKKVQVPIGSQNPSQNNNRISINSNKHITPVSTQLHKHTSKKHLELQLEEAFFHGQPASTRKTVDFISERVASVCIKHIRNTILNSARESNVIAFRQILKEKQIEEDDNKDFKSKINDLKILLSDEMNVLAANLAEEIKKQSEEIIPTICTTRVTDSIGLLLAEDSLLSVKQMCVKITSRMARERINQWMQSHVVAGSLFINDMEIEINRFLRQTSPVHAVKSINHNENASSPTESIDKLRSHMWKLLENNGEVSTELSVLTMLDKLYECINERLDLLPISEKILYSLTNDYALFLIAYRSDIFSNDIQDKFIRIWKLDNFKFMESDSPMLRLLSPRNIMLLAQPENEQAWITCGKFIKKLLETNILTIDSISDQCVALFRHEWPVPLLKNLSRCLTEGIENYKASSETTEKIKCLLGWIAATYRDIECNDSNLID